MSVNRKQQKKFDVNGNVKVGHATVYSGEMDTKVDVDDALGGWQFKMKNTSDTHTHVNVD